ncbi:unnamed protein product [Darwinula stevensoni]|uniref:COX assembly mitochondrial protein n=1 Tax=Darwinula stevensoni TaxID=69355 RepID=A0A7R9AAA5_9CRUS|nr:unnamed protein product [Darwinula stevensoni]CAG0898202.1 unnamed protein product [Darwinula stevensoni]
MNQPYPLTKEQVRLLLLYDFRIEKKAANSIADINTAFGPDTVSKSTAYDWTYVLSYWFYEVMHPDLSPHLHSPECNTLIAELQKCHKENKFKKYFGVCNRLDTAMNRCLKEELEQNRRRNNALALQRRQIVLERQKTQNMKEKT